MRWTDGMLRTGNNSNLYIYIYKERERERSVSRLIRLID
jgi:hypothetical protein